MAVISVPRDLRDRLGDDGSESLVELLRQVGGEQRDDLITMVEERFARRVAETRDELRGEMHAGFLNLHERIGGVQAEIGGVRAELHERIGGVQAEIGGVRAELHERIGGVQAEIGGVRAELHERIGGVQAEIGGVRAELHKEIGDVRKEITTQTRWLVTVLVAASVLIPVMQKVLDALFP